MISCWTGVKNHILTKFDFPAIFGDILEVIWRAKSPKNATCTHFVKLQEQFWTPMDRFKFQTTFKSARSELGGNSPPLETEKGNTFWHLAGTRELLLTLLGVPGQSQVLLGVCGQSSVLQLGAHKGAHLTCGPWLRFIFHCCFPCPASLHLWPSLLGG